MVNNKVQRGSNEPEIDLKKILGENFRNFVQLTEGKSLDNFTFSVIDKDKIDSIHKPNDISPKYTGAVMGIVGALAYLEQPDKSKYDSESNIGDKITELFDYLIAGENYGTKFILTDKFDFIQLPYSDRIETLPNSIFHLVPYSKFYKSYSENSENYLHLMIRFLYHYIATLDLEKLESNGAIDKLFEFLDQDNYLYMKYYSGIYYSIISKEYYNEELQFFKDINTNPNTKNNLSKCITESLKNVVRKIIKLYKSIRVPDINIFSANEILAKKFFSATNMQDHTTGLGTPHGSLPGNKIISVLTANTKLIFDDNANGAKKIGLDFSDWNDDTILRIGKYGMLNPYYLSDNVEQNIIDEKYKKITDNKNPMHLYGGGSHKKINSKNTHKSHTKKSNINIDSEYDMYGGVSSSPSPPLSGTSGGKIISLPLLYGPEYGKGAKSSDPGIGKPAAANISKHFIVTTDLLISTEDLGSGGGAAKQNIVKKTEIEKLYKNDNSGLLNDIIQFLKYGIKETTTLALIQCLSTYRYLLDNQKTVGDVNGDDALKNAAANYIVETLRSYSKFWNRVGKIPKHGKIPKEITDIFVTTFISELKNTSILDVDKNEIVDKPPTVPTATQAGVNKKRLNNNDIFQLYQEDVLAHPDIYSKYFNLIKYDPKNPNDILNPNVDLNTDEAKNINDSNRKFYRLNAKKKSGYISEFQLGGANDYGRVIFIANLPMWNASIGDIWITYKSKVPVNAKTADIIKEIATVTFNNFATNKTITLFPGIDLTRAELIFLVQNLPSPFFGNAADIEKNFLKRITSDPSNLSQERWFEMENIISEDMLRENNKWHRNVKTREYEKIDDSGAVIETKIEENCSLFEDENACLQFLYNCLNDAAISDKNSYEKFCGKLLRLNFKIPGQDKLKELVQKMNPMVAYNILRYFRYGYYTETITTPVKNVTRYRVQSVTSWIKELLEDPESCSQTIPNKKNFPCGTLRQQLGKLGDEIEGFIKKGSNDDFFRFMSILVSWVNANPQVLNPAETGKIEPFVGNYPKLSDAYKIYTYKNPYNKTIYRLENMNCGLSELRANIHAGLMGVNANTTISNITSVPRGTNMPLTHFGFDFPVPLNQFNQFGQFGGNTNIIDTHASLQQINEPLGYLIFNDIYRDILQTMTSTFGENKMKLSSDTIQKIETKLNNLKTNEVELKKSLADLIQRNKLFQATRGFVNPFNANDKEFEELKKKHANLLNLGNSYNRRATNMIEYFQTMIDTILKRIDEIDKKNNNHSGYNRPLISGYIPMRRVNG